MKICVCCDGTATLFSTPTLNGVGGELDTAAAFPFEKGTPLLIE